MFDVPCGITCAFVVALGVVVAPCVIDVFNCTHPSDVHALFSPSFVSLSLILIQQNFALDNLHPLLKKPHNREALNIAMELCTMGY
jgi:hypothetical protein